MRIFVRLGWGTGRLSGFFQMRMIISCIIILIRIRIYALFQYVELLSWFQYVEHRFQYLELSFAFHYMKPQSNI